jgi:hypothetical protein
MNYNNSTVAKLLGHGDLRSIHRYKRGKAILRETVSNLKNENLPKSGRSGAKEIQQVCVNG